MRLLSSVHPSIALSTFKRLKYVKQLQRHYISQKFIEVVTVESVMGLLPLLSNQYHEHSNLIGIILICGVENGYIDHNYTWHRPA